MTRRDTLRRRGTGVGSARRRAVATACSLVAGLMISGSMAPSFAATIAFGNIDDEYQMDQDTTLTVPAPGVYANDTFADGSPYRRVPIQITSGPDHGVLAPDPVDGSFSYTPDPQFSGIDSFTYLGNNPATAWITVTGQDDPPTATDKHFSATDGSTFDPVKGFDRGSLDVPAPGLLAGARDPEGGPVHAELRSSDGPGDAGVQPDGSFSYNVSLDEIGHDVTAHFTYVVIDEAGNESAEAAISIDVTYDPRPVARPDSYTTLVDTPLAVPASAPDAILANDADPGGEEIFPYSYAAFPPETVGSVTFPFDGSFTYRPPPGFVGTDTFRYTVRDTRKTSMTDVTITVVPAGGPPTVSIVTPTNSAQYTVGETVLAEYACTDPDGDSDLVSCSGPVPNGQALDTSASGTFDFAVTATERSGRTTTQSRSYTVVPRPGAVPARLVVGKVFSSGRFDVVSSPVSLPVDGGPLRLGIRDGGGYDLRVSAITGAGSCAVVSPGPSLPARVSARAGLGVLSTLRFDVYCLDGAAANAVTIRSSDPNSDPYVLRLNRGQAGDLALFYPAGGRAVRAGAALTLPPTGAVRIAARSDGPSPVRVTAVEATGGCFVQTTTPLPAVVFAASAGPISFTDTEPLVLDVSCTDPSATNAALLIHTSNPAHDPYRLTLTQAAGAVPARLVVGKVFSSGRFDVVSSPVSLPVDGGPLRLGIRDGGGYDLRVSAITGAGSCAVVSPGPSLPARVSARAGLGVLSTLRFDVYCLDGAAANAVTIRSSDPNSDPYVLRLNRGQAGDLALFYPAGGRAVRAGAALTLPPTGAVRIAARSDGPSPVRVTAVEATGGCFVQTTTPLPAVVFAASAGPISFTDTEPLVLDVSCTDPSATNAALLIHTSNPAHDPYRLTLTAP